MSQCLRDLAFSSALHAVRLHLITSLSRQDGMNDNPDYARSQGYYAQHKTLSESAAARYPLSAKKLSCVNHTRTVRYFGTYVKTTIILVERPGQSCHHIQE